jgi:PD-(D/E)XK endonuclease
VVSDRSEVPLLAQSTREKWGTLRPMVTAKRLGERAEAAFLAKASGLGFGVAKPWADSDRYDFILDAGGRLKKVQVKSSYRAGRDGGYSVRTFGHSLGAYKEDEIDVLVVYVAPEEAWYVFPAEVFRGRRSVNLYPGSKRRRSKFEEWREGWWVMRG